VNDPAATGYKSTRPAPSPSSLLSSSTLPPGLTHSRPHTLTLARCLRDPGLAVILKRPRYLTPTLGSFLLPPLRMPWPTVSRSYIISSRVPAPRPPCTNP
jgi:hypothetical protein